MSVLFVCQGNTCRSAVAQRLAALFAHEALGSEPETAGVRLASAGLGARNGDPVHPMSAEALQELGGSPEGFRSRRFDPSLADGADLVLTMTERQRRSVLEVAPLRLRRTFTLTEAAALLPLADVADLASMAPGERPAELGRRLHAARARRPTPRWSDIADPIGRRPSAHRDAAHQIAAALRPLAEVLFAASARRPDTRTPPPRSAAAVRAEDRSNRR